MFTFPKQRLVSTLFQQQSRFVSLITHNSIPFKFPFQKITPSLHNQQISRFHTILPTSLPFHKSPFKTPLVNSNYLNNRHFPSCYSTSQRHMGIQKVSRTKSSNIKQESQQKHYPTQQYYEHTQEYYQQQQYNLTPQNYYRKSSASSIHTVPWYAQSRQQTIPRPPNAFFQRHPFFWNVCYFSLIFLGISLGMALVYSI
jgi:hypothetical protein